MILPIEKKTITCPSYDNHIFIISSSFTMAPTAISSFKNPSLLPCCVSSMQNHPRHHGQSKFISLTVLRRFGRYLLHSPSSVPPLRFCIIDFVPLGTNSVLCRKRKNHLQPTQKSYPKLCLLLSKFQAGMGNIFCQG